MMGSQTAVPSSHPASHLEPKHVAPFFWRNLLATRFFSSNFTLTVFTVLSKHAIVGYGLRSITVKAEMADQYSWRSLPVIGLRTGFPYTLLGEQAILIGLLEIQDVTKKEDQEHSCLMCSPWQTMKSTFRNPPSIHIHIPYTAHDN